jgi:predicted transcriptional regulator
MQISNSVERTPIELAGEIVSAFAAHNSLQRSELVGLIQSVNTVLTTLAGRSSKSVEVKPEPQAPAVSIRRSITPDYLICLDDGRRCKYLVRYLRKLGMTPDEYRAKWRLPSDYPMTAPSLAAKRSETAKRFGLGKKRKK